MRYPDLGTTLKRDDINPLVVEIPEYARSGVIYLFERMWVVNQSKVHRWWYGLLKALLRKVYLLGSRPEVRCD